MRLSDDSTVEHDGGSKDSSRHFELDLKGFEVGKVEYGVYQGYVYPQLWRITSRGPEAKELELKVSPKIAVASEGDGGSQAEDDDSYLLAQSDDDDQDDFADTSSDNSDNYETLMRPYATLSPT